MNKVHAETIHRIHLRIGDVISRADQDETRMHNERSAGLYECDEIPERDREFVAVEVVLNLAWASRAQ